MKETFLYKFAVRAAFVLHVFGATALVIMVLAMCGVDVNWWIGALSVVPGWLIVFALAKLAEHEQRKMQEAFIDKHTRVLKEILEMIEAEEEPEDAQ